MIEDNFKQLLNEKRSVQPNEGFDNDMMFLIKKHTLNKSKGKKYLKLMYLFFLIGLVLGFTIAITFVDLEFLPSDDKSMLNKIILLIPLTCVILFLFEKIYKATMVSIGKGNFSCSILLKKKFVITDSFAKKRFIWCEDAICVVSHSNIAAYP